MTPAPSGNVGPMRRSLCLAVCLSASALLVACQDEYEEECSAFCPEGVSACPQGEVDCTKNCADQARAADPLGCREQSVAYSECVAGEDVCSEEAPEPCQDEYGALYDCLAAQQGG